MLSEIDFKVIYSTGKDEPSDFFLNALMNSTRFDFGLGYFNSSGFRSLALGFASFIHNGGSMRFVINDSLSLEDKSAIENGYYKSPEEVIEKNIIDTLTKLIYALSSYEKHFFNCISWLISTNKLDIKAFIPTNNKGIVHQKFGMFTDKDNNILAFSGSANFSKSALEHNLETISCHKSWENEKIENERIYYFQQYFNDIWNNKLDVIKNIPIENVKTFIKKNFKNNGMKDLVDEEVALVEKSNLDNTLKIKYIKQLEKIKVLSTNKISEKNSIDEYGITKICSPFELYPFQKDAINAWVKNNYIGLFEMATGTGKTLTALNCLLEILEKDKCLKALILVPTKELIEQWEEEISKFGFTNVVTVYSENPNWYEKCLSLINRSMSSDMHFIIICTYISYNSQKFRSILSKIENDVVLVADEAHNFGTLNLINNYNHQVKKKLALSATPIRHFDEVGTDKLLEYFDSIKGPTLKYSLSDAIENDFLSKYYYYPKLVYLENIELEDYIEISKKIVKYYNINNNSFIDDPILSSLLLKRKRIINKASGKSNCLREIFKELLETTNLLKYTLVYVPEGSSDKYDEEDKQLIDEYSKIIRNEFHISQHQFISGTKNRRDILKQFSEGKLSVLTAMKCLDEGVDVARTENAIFCASTSNPRQFIQRRGRVLRKHPDKKYAKIYDMIVVPDIFNHVDSENIEMEKRIFENELKRAYDFASISQNKYQALKIFQEFADNYNLEIYK